jgi:hypothetical protein
MRRSVLAGALALLLGSALLVAAPVEARPAPGAETPPAHAKVPYAVQVSMIKDGRTQTLWSSKWTGYSGSHNTFSRSTHSVDMNVYRVHEDIRRWQYYLLELGVKRLRGSGNGGAWKSFIAWTDRKVSETTYSEGILSHDADTSCYDVSASLGAGIGPISGSVGISRGIFCGQAPRIKFEQTKSTRGRGGHWTAYSPGSVKAIDFYKVIRVKRGQLPPFHVRLGGPCDYETPTHDLIQDTCYEYYRLKYRDPSLR